MPDSLDTTAAKLASRCGAEIVNGRSPALILMAALGTEHAEGELDGLRRAALLICYECGHPTQGGAEMEAAVCQGGRWVHRFAGTDDARYCRSGHIHDEITDRERARRAKLSRPDAEASTLPDTGRVRALGSEPIDNRARALSEAVVPECVGIYGEDSIAGFHKWAVPIIATALARERTEAARRTLRVVERGRDRDPLRYVLDGLLALDPAALLKAIE